MLADGGRADVVSLTRERLARPVDVYNLEVADYHTYFVASSGVWVHNCGAPPFRDVTTHIFRDAIGHLAEDTPGNRALLQDAVVSGDLVSTTQTPQGGTIQLFHKVLQSGEQVWVEVRNGIEITNGGVNAGPR